MKDNKCEICDFDKYVEGHHIIKRRDLGSDDEENIVYLCPNHHWIADFGDDEDRLEILSRIKEITGKVGKSIPIDEKTLLFKKARRLVEESLGRYTDEEWKEKEMEDSFNFKSRVKLLRVNYGFEQILSREQNKRAELLLLRDKIDSEINKNA
jgi:hypothetical protein